MSEESLRYVPPGSGEEFEHEDLNPRVVFVFLAGLGILCVVSVFVVIGMYDYLDSYQRVHQPPANPLVAPKVEVAKPNYARTQSEIRQVFPEPRLEEDERGQLNSIRLKEEQQLNSYGWVDEKAGVVHIPIELAIRLTAQRGLPVLPEKGAAAPVESKPAGKKHAVPSQSGQGNKQ